jgi:hypothetical protein
MLRFLEQGGHIFWPHSIFPSELPPLLSSLVIKSEQLAEANSINPTKKKKIIRLDNMKNKNKGYDVLLDRPKMGTQNVKTISSH